MKQLVHSTCQKSFFLFGVEQLVNTGRSIWAYCGWRKLVQAIKDGQWYKMQNTFVRHTSMHYRDNPHSTHSCLRTPSYDKTLVHLPMSTIRSPGRVNFHTSSCSFSMYCSRRSWNTTRTMLYNIGDMTTLNSTTRQLCFRKYNRTQLHSTSVTLSQM